MDERELEQRLRTAVEHAAPDPLDRILADPEGYDYKQEESSGNGGPQKVRMFKFIPGFSVRTVFHCRFEIRQYPSHRLDCQQIADRLSMNIPIRFDRMAERVHTAGSGHCRRQRVR